MKTLHIEIVFSDENEVNLSECAAAIAQEVQNWGGVLTNDFDLPTSPNELEQYNEVSRAGKD